MIVKVPMKTKIISQYLIFNTYGPTSLMKVLGERCSLSRVLRKSSTSSGATMMEAGWPTRGVPQKSNFSLRVILLIAGITEAGRGAVFRTWYLETYN
jgi:hypothetical protein